MWSRRGLFKVLTLVAIVAISGGLVFGQSSLPRAQTLYLSGTQYGPPSSWNPWNLSNYATGTIGLVYETLFLYDPLADTYIPWLAESGTWSNDSTYLLKVRQGIKWSDGTPFTAADVKFTFELAKPGKATLSISPLWKWLVDIVQIDDYTLQFHFSPALYQEWSNYLYTVAIVPQHLWASKTAAEVSTGINENPVGTGPYLYSSHTQSTMVWKKNPNWWGKTILGYDPKPDNIVDIVNGSNNTALGMVLQGQLDLSNNFLPGVADLINRGYVQAYYDQPPYMLSANTAWLIMNLQEKPLNDAAFRKAMAFGINVQQIIEKDYGNIVAKANPSGLLPIWSEYIDQSVVNQLGFSYDPAKAKSMLAAAGYKDVNGDGYVEAPDGSAITLKIMVPNGWTDWMQAIQIISDSLKAVGINVVPDYPEYPSYVDNRLQGTFDLAIDNQPQMSNTVWSYYDWMFQNPLSDIPTVANGNYGRYDNQEAFNLVDLLDQTPMTDTAQMKTLTSKLQTIMLTDLPVIPLWYNGLWAQYSNACWTNWPSAAGDNHYLPASWRGYWNMTGIMMLINLQPTGNC